MYIIAPVIVVVESVVSDMPFAIVAEAITSETIVTVFVLLFVTTAPLFIVTAPKVIATAPDNVELAVNVVVPVFVLNVVAPLAITILLANASVGTTVGEPAVKSKTPPDCIVVTPVNVLRPIHVADAVHCTVPETLVVPLEVNATPVNCKTAPVETVRLVDTIAAAVIEVVPVETVRFGNVIAAAIVAVP